MSDPAMVLAEIKRAHTAAIETAEEIGRRYDRALAAGDYEELQRCATLQSAAQFAAHEAAQRTITALLNTPNSTVKTLVGATNKLEERLAKLKADAAKLVDVAVAISILTNAIQLIAMV